MRYWLLLLTKMSVALLSGASCLWLLNLFYAPRTPFFHLAPFLFAWDLLYTSLAGVVFLITYGLFYLAILDQRYRCRTCLNRLCMPVETGSWSRMLQLGRPHMEYICPYGHGQLNVAEIQFTGLEQPHWKQYGGIWEELYATHDGESSR